MMKIKLIRHATLWLEYGGATFLIDPMLSAQGVNPPIMNSGNERRNPLVSLPGPVQQWLEPDAVLVTHASGSLGCSSGRSAVQGTAGVLSGR